MAATLVLVGLGAAAYGALDMFAPLDGEPAPMNVASSPALRTLVADHFQTGPGLPIWKRPTELWQFWPYGRTHFPTRGRTDQHYSAAEQTIRVPAPMRATNQDPTMPGIQYGESVLEGARRRRSQMTAEIPPYRLDKKLWLPSKKIGADMLQTPLGPVYSMQ